MRTMIEFKNKEKLIPDLYFEFHKDVVNTVRLIIYQNNISVHFADSNLIKIDSNGLYRRVGVCSQIGFDLMPRDQKLYIEDQIDMVV